MIKVVQLNKNHCDVLLESGAYLGNFSRKDYGPFEFFPKQFSYEHGWPWDLLEKISHRLRTVNEEAEEDKLLLKVFGENSTETEYT